MAVQLQSVRGMRDILPPESCRWQKLLQHLATILHQYAYQPADFPLLEKTALFSRSIGEVTDIVEKEMYTFADRNDESVSLRPEATAGVVRAMIEHGLLQQTQKLWTYGPMFRYERPQKGRYRQFAQISVEAFGMAEASLDAELMLIGERMWQSLGIRANVRLEINTLGLLNERQEFRRHLVDYFSAHFDELDEDSQRRLNSNPLRILDSKNAAMRPLIEAAPKLYDFLGESSRTHYQRVLSILEHAGVKYVENPFLVRGLDYYCHSVFEWVTEELGAQGTICGGGRYDALVEQLGGKPTPAAGFAIGMDRLLALCDSVQSAALEIPNVWLYAIAMGAEAELCLSSICERLRDAFPQHAIVFHHGDQSLKNQLKKADQTGARWCAIVGTDELAKHSVQLKDLQKGTSTELAATQLVEFLSQAS